MQRFEEEALRRTLDASQGARQCGLAVDVGCGDGRHSRVLAKYFSEVIAFDLSPAMIRAAQNKDAQQMKSSAGHITYYECDVEYETFPEEESIRGQADFVCASFGMPSFVKDTAAFARRVYSWLKPEGRALFTFYNSQSLSLGVDLPWKERSLSAAIDLARHALDVELRQGVRFSIYCRALDDRVRDIVRACFSIEEEYSFPHVMAILPPSVFGSDDKPSTIARDVFPRIDRLISWQKFSSKGKEGIPEAGAGDNNVEILPKSDRAMSDHVISSPEKNPGRGHYWFFILKRLPAQNEGYLRVLHALDTKEVKYEILGHPPVVSTGDVQKCLGINWSQMIKTVIFKRSDINEYVVALVLAKGRVAQQKLAMALGCHVENLVLTPAQDVALRFGFFVGGSRLLVIRRIP